MTSQSAGPMKATPCSTKTICLFQSFPLLLCLLGLKAVLRKPRTRDAPTTWVLARFFFWVFGNFFCGSCPCITWARDSSKTTAAAVQESKAAPPRPWRSRAQSIGRSKLGIKLRCDNGMDTNWKHFLVDLHPRSPISALLHRSIYQFLSILQKLEYRFRNLPGTITARCLTHHVICCTASPQTAWALPLCRRSCLDAN